MKQTISIEKAVERLHEEVDNLEDEGVEWLFQELVARDAELLEVVGEAEWVIVFDDGDDEEVRQASDRLRKLLGE